MIVKSLTYMIKMNLYQNSFFSVAFKLEAIHYKSKQMFKLCFPFN